jgi:hypothetical protein
MKQEYKEQNEHQSRSNSTHYWLATVKLESGKEVYMITNTPVGSNTLDEAGKRVNQKIKNKYTSGEITYINSAENINILIEWVKDYFGEDITRDYVQSQRD